MKIKSTLTAIATFSAVVSTLGFVGTQKASALSVTASEDGNAFVNSILGSGISVSPGSVNYSGATGSSGFFTGGSSSIGINSGIILTSGLAKSAEGPNSADNIGTNTSASGDSDLDLLSGGNTNDASVLEFDFETAGGDLFFNYVFASEEYNEFTNSNFNDVFGFFLDGNNIALVPGTSTPVAINTVNGGDPLGTNASNAAFFNNNDLSDGGPFFDVEYDGFTDVFTAQALGLAAGTHTIKLAIADTQDSVFDSAVFIQGSSFSDTSTTPADEIPTPALLPGLVGLGISALRKRKAQEAC